MTNDKLADWLHSWRDSLKCEAPCKAAVCLCNERVEQIIAALRRSEPQPIHRECEQCGMLVACWSDEQIEAIKRDTAAFRAKIKPAIDAVTGKPQVLPPSSDKVLVPRRLSAETIVQISNKVGIGAAAIIDAHNLMLAAAEAEGKS